MKVVFKGVLVFCLEVQKWSFSIALMQSARLGDNHFPSFLLTLGFCTVGINVCGHCIFKWVELSSSFLILCQHHSFIPHSHCN